MKPEGLGRINQVKYKEQKWKGRPDRESNMCERLWPWFFQWSNRCMRMGENFSSECCAGSSQGHVSKGQETLFKNLDFVLRTVGIHWWLHDEFLLPHGFKYLKLSEGQALKTFSDLPPDKWNKPETFFFFAFHAWNRYKILLSTLQLSNFHLLTVHVPIILISGKCKVSYWEVNQKYLSNHRLSHFKDIRDHSVKNIRGPSRGSLISIVGFYWNSADSLKFTISTLFILGFMGFFGFVLPLWFFQKFFLLWVKMSYVKLLVLCPYFLFCFLELHRISWIHFFLSG